MGKLLFVSISLMAVVIFVNIDCEAITNYEIETEIQEIQRRAAAQGVKLQEEEWEEDELDDVAVPAIDEAAKRRRKRAYIYQRREKGLR